MSLPPPRALCVVFVLGLLNAEKTHVRNEVWAADDRTCGIQYRSNAMCSILEKKRTGFGFRVQGGFRC